MNSQRYIIKLEFEIVPLLEEYVKINRFSGLMVRTFLYRMLLPKLEVTDTHEKKDLKPFSTTPIYEISDKKIKIYERGEEIRHGYFEIRFLEIDKPMRVLDAISNLKEIRLDTHLFRVLNLKLYIKSYIELLKDLESIREFEINFLTPTALRSPSVYVSYSKIENDFREVVKYKKRRRGIYLPIPHPNLIFKNILRQFRRFSGLIIPYDEINEFIENDRIALVGYPKCLRTKAIKISQEETYIGFIGKVSFEVYGNEEIKRYINALLRFSEYSNIGVGRTAGLGWCKVG